MGYWLGVDLGTTFTAAAIARDGRAEVASLGNRSAAIPSVVLLRADETILTGDAASRRALTEPDRVAREFKRRLGDTTPILLGSAPYSAEALMSRLLRWVVAEVVAREGSAPDRVAVSHPANWGPYKQDLLHQAARLADLVGVRFLTEPEAAAIHYASQERVEIGQIVAVYDLGGGTFDAAVLRRTATGFEILGQPEGIERLGGIDFDAAVFAHVARALGGKLDELDDSDPGAIAAVARLRADCTDAKEALSSDTDTSIPVMLPNVQTDVRLTRVELEAMVRPALVDSIDALRRALRSANVTPDQVHKVLLVGGSSRIPLVAQMVGAELGRPVVVDSHPKHAVALGAALAAGAVGAAPASAPPTPGGTTNGLNLGPARLAAPASPTASRGEAAAPTFAPPPPPAGPSSVAASATPRPIPTPPEGAATTARSDAAPVIPIARPKRRKMRPAVLGAAAAVVVAVGVATFALGRGGGGGGATQTSSPSATSASIPDTSPVTNVTTSPVTTATSPSTVATVATTTPPDPCADLRALPKFACITAVRLEGRAVVADYEWSLDGAQPNIDGGQHFHFYSSTIPPNEAGVPGGGPWVLWDAPVFSQPVTNAIFRGSEQLCVLVATPGHAIVADTGNCIALPPDIIAAASGR